MSEQTTMRAAVEKAQSGQPMTDFELLLARAAMVLLFLAERREI